MNKWKRLVLGEVGLILIISGIIFGVNLLPTKISSENNSGTELFFPKLAEKQFIKSEFVANNNFLNRVDILFKNPNLESRDELLITIRNDNQLIFEKSFSGFNFGDTSRARLDLVPIVDSKGKIYTIEVKITKIIDGKLAVGMRSNNLLDTVVYYQSNSSLKRAAERTGEVWGLIVSKQLGVFLLPAILWGWWLW